MKRIIALILLISMCMGTTVTSFAEGKIEQSNQDFSMDKYIPYKIDFSSSVHTRNIEKNTVESAIEYVKSLDLAGIGYPELEEACLCELEEYKSQGVELEYYTVLVPKARAKTLFGTYSGSEFYEETTSASSVRRETDGKKKTTANSTSWDKWVKAIVDLVFTFYDTNYSIPYSVVQALTGVVDSKKIYNGSYTQYVEQFSDIKTRTIYKKRGTSYSACYQDQTGNWRTNAYFCPVGTAFESDYIKVKEVAAKQIIKSNKASKTEILKSANAYANKNSIVKHIITKHAITESWE